MNSLSDATSNFDDMSEYEKIKLDKDTFEHLNLTPEEELIIKKYLYYSKDISFGNLSKEQIYHLYFKPVVNAIFFSHNKEYALCVLDCLGKDLAKKNIERAWKIVGEFSLYSYNMDSYLIKCKQGEM